MPVRSFDSVEPGGGCAGHHRTPVVVWAWQHLLSSVTLVLDVSERRMKETEKIDGYSPFEGKREGFEEPRKQIIEGD